MTVTTTAEPASPLPESCHLPSPRIRQELRKIAGLTQEDIATQFGVSDAAVSRWERCRPGRKHLRRYLLLLLAWSAEARAAGLPIAWPPQPTEPQK